MPPKTTEMEKYAHRLLLSNTLREPAIRSAIQSLQLAPGSRGLDVGCGIGLHTPLLVQVTGPTGYVIGIDLSPELLVVAEERKEQRERADNSGDSQPTAFGVGDMAHLPFDDSTFDWVWSADTVHPGLHPDKQDPLAVVKEFIRVVKPGGDVVLVYWSSQRLLPGYSLLEARLDTAFAESVPYMTGIRPDLHFMCAPGWLRAAGLDLGMGTIEAHTFVAEVQAPLDEDRRQVMALIFDMFWGHLQSRLRPDDWAEFQRLSRPESPDFIGDRPDYYAFLTYSLFRGKVAKIR